MPDPVYEATLKALEGRVDPTQFEKCAVALLREYYPSLRPVPEQHDAGQDGLGELPDGTRFFLAATTAKDYRRNLFKSANSHVDAGGDRRAVVLATSRPVSGQAREKLRSDLREKAGVYLVDVHDRGDFAQLLYHHPQWRKDLLDVPGVAGALSRFPASSRPTPPIPLVGRDSERESLKTTDGDLVILGKAGIGKTFLLHALVEDGWGLFDTGGGLSALEDAIREMKPLRVIIDDAHFGPDRITEICRLRKAMNADFALVATSWPGQKNKVEGAFPETPLVLSLEELDRDQILAIVESVGIAGPEELQWQLILQAHGRPGLAVTLARACVSGYVMDVLAGEALLRDVVRWYDLALGEQAQHVLGFLGLAGSSGASVEEAAAFLDLDLPTAIKLIRGLASGGTIDEASPRQPGPVVVQPEALRYPLVREMFFGGPGSPDVKAAVAALPAPSIAAFPLVAAALAGADLDEAWLEEIGDWSNERFASHFAVLGPKQFRVALKRAPSHPQAIAKEAYSRDIDREHALWTLMEFPDPQVAPWGGETPLNSIKALLQRLDGRTGERQLAIGLADRWLQEGRDPEIALTVLSHAMRPEISGTSHRPGAADVMTISAAILPMADVEALAGMWNSVLDILEREHPNSFATVLGMLEPWVFPGTLAFGRGPRPDILRVMHTAVKPVIQRLADMYVDSWVAMYQLRPLAHTCGVEVSLPEPFATMFPADRWDASGDYQAWEQEMVARTQGLAEVLSQQPIQEVARLIAIAELEASEAGINYPRLTPQLVQHLARVTGHPLALLSSLEECAAPNDLLAEVAACLADQKSPTLETELERLLGDPATASAAFEVALMRPVARKVKEQAIAQLTPRNFDFDGAAIRNELDHPTLKLLLHAPDDEVAWRMALALWAWRHRDALDGLPDELRHRARDLVVNHPADHQLYESLFRQEPDILADWIRAWWERLRNGSFEFLPFHSDELVADLPIETRLDLIGEIPPDLLPDQRLATQLVASDLRAAKTLFERKDLEYLHGAALRGHPDKAWMDRALLALEYGWTPELTAFETSLGSVAFSGEASAFWQKRVAAFETLQPADPSGEPNRAKVVAAGIALYEQKRDEDLERERHDQVFGRGA